MATMSFIDEMKDKAARIIPSAYSEIVEETTSDVLLAPNFQNIVFICDSANSNSENVTDIVRAVRRRLDNKSAKVQFFTIQLLDSLVKNCGSVMHVEIAETKGLLHDLFLVATRKPARDGDREATKAALALILNMSLWFSGHPEGEKVKPLADLADHVRKAAGVNIFEGIEPDTTVQLRRTSAGQSTAHRQNAALRRQRRQEEEYLRLQQEYALQAIQQERSRPQIFDAIPIIIPSEDEISGMLDACLVLAECLNAAEAQGSQVVGDDVISNVALQIRRDHRNLSMILSSGAEIPNMDMLFNVTDSQTAIIQRLSECVKKDRRQQADAYAAAVAASTANAVPQAPSQPSAEQQALHAGAPVPRPGASETQAPSPQLSSSSAGDPPASSSSAGVAPQSSGHDRRQPIRLRQAEDVEDYVEMQVTPKIPPSTQPIPTMDDLFGQQQQQQQAASTSQVSSAFPAPSQSVDHRSAAPAFMSHSDAAPAIYESNHSVNTDDGDEFDNFLNSRLRK